MSIQLQTNSNIKWSFIESISLKIVAFLLSIILARLLEPKIFGVLAIVNVFYLMVNIFVDGGLRQALIQKKDATEIDYSTVFWLNLALSIILYGCLFISAPYIENYYQFENLSYYIRLQSIVLIIDSFSIVQIAKATKQLNLKKITTARIPASLISFLLGIGLAYLDYGVLALIWQQIIYACIYVLLLITNIKYKPQLLFNKEVMIELYKYGLRVLGISFISRFYVQGLNLLFGKFYSPALLGLYTKGNSLQKTPVEILSTSITKGIYPTMVAYQDDDTFLGDLLVKNLKVTLALVAIVNCILFFEAKIVVSLLLGKQWLSMVPYLQILCISGLFFPIASQCQNIFMAKNKLNIFIKIEVVSKVLVLALIFFLINFYSFKIILITIAGVFFITSLGYIILTSSLLNLKIVRTVFDIYRIIMVHFVIGAIIYYVLSLLIVHSFLTLALFCMLFTVSTMSFYYQLHKPWLVELFNSIKKIF